MLDLNNNQILNDVLDSHAGVYVKQYGAPEVPIIFPTRPISYPPESYSYQTGETSTATTETSSQDNGANIGNLVQSGVELAAMLAQSGAFKKNEAKKAAKDLLKSRCGRKPLFGKAKRASYFKCVNQVTKEQRDATHQDQIIQEQHISGKGKSTALWVIGGIVAIGMTTLIIVLLTKKK